MEFLLDNRDSFIAIGLTILILGLGFGITYAKKKNWIKQDDIDNAHHLLVVTQMVLDFFKVDPKFAAESKTVFDACKQALDYATNVMNVTDDENRKKVAYDAVENAMKQLGVVIDEDKKALIEVGISYAISKIDII